MPGHTRASYAPAPSSATLKSGAAGLPRYVTPVGSVSSNASKAVSFNDSVSAGATGYYSTPVPSFHSVASDYPPTYHSGAPSHASGPPSYHSRTSSHHTGSVRSAHPGASQVHHTDRITDHHPQVRPRPILLAAMLLQLQIMARIIPRQAPPHHQPLWLPIQSCPALRLSRSPRRRTIGSSPITSKPSFHR